MARKKSYFAKANRGKAGSVFLNNIAAASKKSANERKKANDKERRGAVRRERQANAAALKDQERQEKEIASSNKKKIRESQRIQKETEKLHKQLEREQKKYNIFSNRMILEFEKKNIIPNKVIIRYLFEESLKADLTVSKAVKLLFEPNEEEIRSHSLLREMQEMISSSHHSKIELEKNHSRLLTFSIVNKLNLNLDTEWIEFVGRCNRLDQEVVRRELVRIIKVRKQNLEIKELQDFSLEVDVNLLVLPKDLGVFKNLLTTIGMNKNRLQENETFKNLLKNKTDRVESVTRKTNSFISN